MPTELKRKLRLIFFEYDWSGIELVFALYALFWGIILVLPYDTFTSSPSLNKIELWFNEGVFGSMTLALGLISLISLIRYSLNPSIQTLKLRKYSCLLALLYWGFMMALFIVSGKYNLGLSWCFVTVSFLAINYWRLVDRVKNLPYGHK